MSKSNFNKQTFFSFLKELYKERRNYVLMIVSLLATFIVVTILLNVFFDITENLSSEELIELDDKISLFFHSLRSESLNPWIKALTNLGDKYAYFILIPISIAVLIFLKKRWQVIIQAMLVLASATFLNIGIKNLISRPRPDNNLHLVEALSYSYPSGHIMSAAAFYGFIIYLIFRYIGNVPLKITLITLLTLLIIGIGLSRIYLGVHYPSDVLAGLIAGLVWLLVWITIFRIFNFYRIRKRNSV